MRTGRAPTVPASSDAAVHVTIALADLEARTGCGEVLGRPRPEPSSSRRSCAGSRATRRSSRTCSARRGRTLTWAGWCACSPAPSAAGCGAGTGAAPTPGALRPRPGPAPITCCTGPTVAPPTSTTRRCSASGTTPWSTSAACGRRSGSDADEQGRYRGVGPARRRLRPPPRGAPPRTGGARPATDHPRTPAAPPEVTGSSAPDAGTRPSRAGRPRPGGRGARARPDVGCAR